MASLSPHQTAVYLKYADLSLPRHTSYPAANFWRDGWTPAQHARSLGDIKGPMALYVHVPFCEKLCFYCGCTREIVPATSRSVHDPADDYLGTLALELAHVAKATGRRALSGVHFGGGTPTFLSVAQIHKLWGLITSTFDVRHDAELAVEIDPRTIAGGKLEALRQCGFNRISLGVQDFDPQVQAAVNRLQPFELVKDTIKTARNLGFSSINVDLIYGLPWQTEASMERTLDRVIELSPDRIAYYRLAVIPDMFRWQRAFTRLDLPDRQLTMALMLKAIKRFTDAGYQFIGLDHFAKPNDPLAVAASKGELGRTFQGMTKGRGHITVGVGPSAISTFADGFSQNDRQYAGWTKAVQAHGLATTRGFKLTADDRVRGAALADLYGKGSIDFHQFELRHWVKFRDYFATHLPALTRLAADDIIEINESGLKLTPVLGRLLTRVVASVLDSYLPEDAWRRGLATGGSKVG